MIITFFSIRVDSNTYSVLHHETAANSGRKIVGNAFRGREIENYFMRNFLPNVCDKFRPTGTDS